MPFFKNQKDQNLHFDSQQLICKNFQFVIRGVPELKKKSLKQKKILQKWAMIWYLNNYLNMKNPGTYGIYAFLAHTNYIIIQMNFLLSTIKDIHESKISGTLSILTISKKKFLSIIKTHTNKETYKFIEKLSTEIFKINWETKFYIILKTNFSLYPFWFPDYTNILSAILMIPKLVTVMIYQLY